LFYVLIFILVFVSIIKIQNLFITFIFNDEMTLPQQLNKHPKIELNNWFPSMPSWSCHI